MIASQALWCISAVPAIWEAEAGEILEPRSLRPHSERPILKTEEGQGGGVAVTWQRHLG